MLIKDLKGQAAFGERSEAGAGKSPRGKTRRVEYLHSGLDLDGTSIVADCTNHFCDLLVTVLLSKNTTKLNNRIG